MAGRPGKMIGMVAQHQISDYHIITIPVKKYLEVIEGEEDSFWKLETCGWRTGSSRARGYRMACGRESGES